MQWSFRRSRQSPRRGRECRHRPSEGDLESRANGERITSETRETPRRGHPDGATAMTAEGRLASDFCVGTWIVRPSLSRIEHGARAVHLTPRAMSVLAYLGAAHGAVVSRNELLDAVWPRMSVTPEALSQCIAELRRAFGDDSRHHRDDSARRAAVGRARRAVAARACAARLALAALAAVGRGRRARGRSDRRGLRAIAAREPRRRGSQRRSVRALSDGALLSRAYGLRPRHTLRGTRHRARSDLGSRAFDSGIGAHVATRRSSTRSAAHEPMRPR